MLIPQLLWPGCAFGFNGLGVLASHAPGGKFYLILIVISGIELLRDIEDDVRSFFLVLADRDMSGSIHIAQNSVLVPIFRGHQDPQLHLRIAKLPHPGQQINQLPLSSNLFPSWGSHGLSCPGQKKDGRRIIYRAGIKNIIVLDVGEYCVQIHIPAQAGRQNLVRCAQAGAGCEHAGQSDQSGCDEQRSIATHTNSP